MKFVKLFKTVFTRATFGEAFCFFQDLLAFSTRYSIFPNTLRQLPWRSPIKQISSFVIDVLFATNAVVKN